MGLEQCCQFMVSIVQYLLLLISRLEWLVSTTTPLPRTVQVRMVLTVVNRMPHIGNADYALQYQLIEQKDSPDHSGLQQEDNPGGDCHQTK